MITTKIQDVYMFTIYPNSYIFMSYSVLKNVLKGNFDQCKPTAFRINHFTCPIYWQLNESDSGHVKFGKTQGMLSNVTDEIHSSWRVRWDPLSVHPKFAWWTCTWSVKRNNKRLAKPCKRKSTYPGPSLNLFVDFYSKHGNQQPLSHFLMTLSLFSFFPLSWLTDCNRILAESKCSILTPVLFSLDSVDSTCTPLPLLALS